MKLAHDAHVVLTRRKVIGEICIAAAQRGDGTPVTQADFNHRDDDIETAASDAISDILTAVFGHAGIWDGQASIIHDDEAIAAARALLDRAMRSYLGDAEDYYAEDGAEAGQC